MIVIGEAWSTDLMNTTSSRINLGEKEEGEGGREGGERERETQRERERDRERGRERSDEGRKESGR